jgi:hypothetical protein
MSNGSNGAMTAAAKRGMKREHEDDIPLAQVVANAQKRAVVTGSVGQQPNLKNGMGVGPPRPMKKARTVSVTLHSFLWDLLDGCMAVATDYARIVYCMNGESGEGKIEYIERNRV